MPDASTKKPVAESRSETTRLGLILFAIYATVYTIFVVVNAFAPETMERMPIPGVNLAILYGFMLIFVAFVLAILYGWMCRAARED